MPTSDAPIIHIIDDEESLRTALSRLLRVTGYRVALHESAEAFLQSKQSNGPGCILLDFNMAGMNGLQLQEQLAQDQNTLPIIFLSGNGNESIHDLAMHGGAYGFLSKPVVKEELLNTIERALTKST